MRASALLVLAALGIAATAMYQLKYEVAALEDERRSTARQLAAERQAIHVLAAEWAYLNQPERLAELAARHLDLVPLEGTHFVTFADLPRRDTELAEAGEAGAQEAPR